MNRKEPTAAEKPRAIALAAALVGSLVTAVVLREPGIAMLGIVLTLTLALPSRRSRQEQQARQERYFALVTPPASRTGRFGLAAIGLLTSSVIGAIAYAAAALAFADPFDGVGLAVVLTMMQAAVFGSAASRAHQPRPVQLLIAFGVGLWLMLVFGVLSGY